MCYSHPAITMLAIHHAHPAMATRFEAILVGDDAEQLDAVAALVFEEIDRVEHLLSRFDRASEVFRVNAEAAQRTVRISVELADVIEDCHAWWGRTDGFFDITAASSAETVGPAWHGVEFDREQRTLRFSQPGLRLDFGGYGKGYALDRVERLLAQYNVANAFVHGGTSSVLARGVDADGKIWQVDLPDGSAIALDNESLSTSEFELGNGRRIACSVVARSGAAAEALSTALVRMERSQAIDFCAAYRRLHPKVRIERQESAAS